MICVGLIRERYCTLSMVEGACEAIECRYAGHTVENHVDCRFPTARWPRVGRYWRFRVLAVTDTRSGPPIKCTEPKRKLTTYPLHRPWSNARPALLVIVIVVKQHPPPHLDARFWRGRRRRRPSLFPVLHPRRILVVTILPLALGRGGRRGGGGALGALQAPRGLLLRDMCQRLHLGRVQPASSPSTSSPSTSSSSTQSSNPTPTPHPPNHNQAATHLLLLAHHPPPPVPPLPL